MVNRVSSYFSKGGLPLSCLHLCDSNRSKGIIGLLCDKANEASEDIVQPEKPPIVLSLFMAMMVLGVYVPPTVTAEVKQRRAFGFKYHPKPWRSLGSNS